MTLPDIAMTFTELLLVMLLFLMFAVIMVKFSSNSSSNKAQLNEGVDQLTSLLRYSKAIAQQTGKMVVVTFPHTATGDAAELATTNSTVEVTVEAEYSGFVELPAATTMAASIDELIKVVELHNTSKPQSIVFYPDGSSDDALLVIYSLNDNDQRRSTIKLNSLNGTIKQQP